jgi:hypothetical protein
MGCGFLEMSLSARARRLGHRLGVLALAIAVLRLPIFDLFRYGLLVAAALVVFTGVVTQDWKRWIAALAVTIVAAIALTAWPSPQIEEGYNFYFNTPQLAADLQLPPDVARAFEQQFTAQYPAAQRCAATVPSAPRYAYSADAIYDHPMFSRRVTGIDFSDPVHLRLGDINKGVYNQQTDRCGIVRFSRDTKSLDLFDRFRLLYPLYLVYQFPKEFVGSELCWRGTVLWPHGDGRFDVIDHTATACRPLTPDDIGRTIYAASIKHTDPLSMHLKANTAVEMRRAVDYGLTLLGVLAVVLLLIAWKPRRVCLPALLVALTLLVTVFVDVTFIGGFRPLDDGDDGFTYEGYSREMAHHLMAGDVSSALRGEESVYYFTPGFRYFRTFERFVFGDTYLGYLSIMLAMPFVVLALFRRFMSESWALVLTLTFVAIPVGNLFGSTLLHYIVWAARGFADPLAFFFLFAGVLLIVPKRSEVETPPALTAFLGALLLATAAFCRPNLVLASGVMAFAATLMALAQRRLGRAAAIYAGFGALTVSPLHNYVFGHSTVLFSDNVNQPRTLLMSPLDYLNALGEIAHLDFTGPHVGGAVRQLSAWLSGPSEILALVPLHAAAVAVLVRVGLFGSRFDRWLRIVALATLLQHGIGVCYVNSARYNLGTWLLTTLVCAAWVQAEGLGLFDRTWPGLRQRWLKSAGARRLAAGIRRIESMASS